MGRSFPARGRGAIQVSISLAIQRRACVPTRAGLGVVPLDTSAWMVERAIAVRRMTSRRCSSTAGLCRVRVGSGISPVAPVLALTSAVREKIATRGQVSARRATLHAWSTPCRRCRGRRRTLRGSPLARGQDGGGAAAPARVSAVWPLGGCSGVGGRGCDAGARPSTSLSQHHRRSKPTGTTHAASFTMRCAKAEFATT